MPLHIDVVVIGAGQAGLALSHCLTARGIEHVVLDRGRVGERWRSERWPGLRLLTPNWMTQLPGLPAGAEPDGFMPAGEFAGLLDRYAESFCAPLVTGCEVLSLERGARGFVLRTTLGGWSANQVVIATGACDRPAVPDWARALPAGVRQVTPAAYRGPDDLPPGGVLVVGASATGIQIAGEVRRSGRPVTLAVGRHVRTPRRYRGRDIFRWLDESGFLRQPRDPAADNGRLLAMPSLQLAGNADGGDIGLDPLAALGVTITGRATGVRDGRVEFAATLARERAAAEARRQGLLAGIDLHVSRHAPDAPEDPAAWAPPAPMAEGPRTLDLCGGAVRTVVWATGFRRRYPWLRLPVLDAAGEIETRGGRTRVPGLFVLGLPFLRHRSSAFIYGVGRDAEWIAAAIEAGRRHPHLIAA